MLKGLVMQQWSMAFGNFEASVLWGNNMRFEPHGHDEFVVSTNICGNENFRLDQKSMRAASGATTYFNPEQIQSGEGTNKLVSLYLRHDMFNKDFHLAGDVNFETPVHDCQATRVAMERLQSLIMMNAEAGIIEELSLKILQLGLQSNTQCKLEKMPSLKDWRVERVKQRLLDDLSETPSLNNLAEEVQLAKATLIRMFSTATGFPPLTWQRARRLQKARTMLRNGRSIAGVAMDLGFSDQAHLNRHFKSAFGLSPGKIQTGH
jgi:AraC family transcriptional regulator, chemosensory pili system protein ChpD